MQENYGRLVGRGPLVLLFIDTADTAHARLLDVLRHVASAAATAHPNLSFGVISAVRCLNHTYVSASECKYARESLKRLCAGLSTCDRARRSALVLPLDCCGRYHALAKKLAVGNTLPAVVLVDAKQEAQ